MAKTDENKPETKGGPTVQERVALVVEAWKAEHLHNTPFSQNTEAWNTLQAALPHLGDMIAKEVG